MMAVILLILKVILYILLSLLGLIILFLGLVLFLPIAYEGKGSYDEMLWIKAKVKIFYMCTIHFLQEEEQSDLKITLFGRQIFAQPDQEKESSKAKREPMEPEKPDSIKSATIEAMAQSQNSEKIESTEPHKKSKKKDKPKPQKRVQKAPKKSLWQSIKETLQIVKTLWTDENKSSFLRAIKKLLGQLWKTIKPSELKFRLIVGRESPDETGQLLAGLAFLFPLYGQYGTIQGDFEKATIRGVAQIKGKFNVCQLIKPFVVLALNRCVRNYIHLILNVRKEDQHGNKIK